MLHAKLPRGRHADVGLPLARILRRIQAHADQLGARKMALAVARVSAGRNIT